MKDPKDLEELARSLGRAAGSMGVAAHAASRLGMLPLMDELKANSKRWGAMAEAFEALVRSSK